MLQANGLLMLPADAASKLMLPGWAADATTKFTSGLREFACELTSSWPPARAEGMVWDALLGQHLANLGSRS